MLSSKEIDWQKFIDNGERLGMRIEEEADLARRDERMDLKGTRTTGGRRTFAKARTS